MQQTYRQSRLYKAMARFACTMQLFKERSVVGTHQPNSNGCISLLSGGDRHEKNTHLLFDEATRMHIFYRCAALTCVYHIAPPTGQIRLARSSSPRQHDSRCCVACVLGTQERVRPACLNSYTSNPVCKQAAGYLLVLPRDPKGL